MPASPVEDAFPVVEFDPEPAALIEPRARRTTRPVPERAVMCFFQEVIAEACGDGKASEIGRFTWAQGRIPSTTSTSTVNASPCSTRASARRWRQE